MIKSIQITRWLSSPVAQKLKGRLVSATRILTLSLADEPIAPASCLSISIGIGSVSLVYAKRSLSSYTALHSKTYNCKEGEYPDPEEVVSAAARFMGEKKLAAAPVTLCIPKTWTITKTSEFPASVGDDLLTSIRYEMDRLTPFSSDEVFFDYKPLGLSGGKVQFILAVAKIDTVKEYLDALKSRGHVAGRLTSAPSALGSLKNFSDKNKGKAKPLLVNKETDHQALGGAVEALWPDAGALNLLSRGARPTLKKSYALTAALAAVFLVMLAVYSAVPFWQEKELAKSMDQKISAIKKNAMSVEKIKQEIEALDDKISLIEDFHADETRRIILLKELTRIIPDDTWINRIRISENNVELYGYSEAATKLISKLEASKHFSGVEFSSPIMRDSKMDMDRFAIKAKAGDK